MNFSPVQRQRRAPSYPDVLLPADHSSFGGDLQIRRYGNALATMGANVQNASVLVPTLSDRERSATIRALPTLVNIQSQERIMNKDQAKGRVEEVKGKVKEVAGKVSGNKDMEQKGKIQNAGGKIRAGFGDLKEDLKKSA
jgi:uncharacterized protein YjbJ (UPF0337 family)